MFVYIYVCCFSIDVLENVFFCSKTTAWYRKQSRSRLVSAVSLRSTLPPDDNTQLKMSAINRLHMLSEAMNSLATTFYGVIMLRNPSSKSG